MSTQRKLDALLFELQSARNPLAQAKVLARAWRTVRELSPTDRRLLARHAGFDGADQILEGLARRGGGFAPAMLLQVLTNARNADSSTVSELVSALQDPNRRQEAVTRGVDLASDLLADSEDGVPDQVLEDALGELQAVEEVIEETPEEAIAALTALENAEPIFISDAEMMEAPPEPKTPELNRRSAPVTREPQIPPPPSPGVPVDAPGDFPDQSGAAESLRRTAPSPEVDWSRWNQASPSPNPAPSHDVSIEIARPEIGSKTFDTGAVMGALGAEGSSLSQLRVLRRELSGFAGSSAETLRRVLEGFPDGWARRRALAALLEAGIPSRIDDALDLIEGLGREMDRRWCLGILAEDGRLKGRSLDRGLDLLHSPMARRRVEAAARIGRRAPAVAEPGDQSVAG
jgi:hypothetical protein